MKIIANIQNLLKQLHTLWTSISNAMCAFSVEGIPTNYDRLSMRINITGNKT